jgi:hypothetical protein
MLTATPQRSNRIRVLRRQSLRRPTRVAVYPVRPSVLDLRISGDPWISAADEETLSLCFNSWQMTAVRGVCFDLPAFNGILDRLRHRLPRRRRCV